MPDHCEPKSWVFDDTDYAAVRELCDSPEGWTIVYEKSTLRVWTRPVADCAFHMIKVRTDWSDVSAADAFDAIQDADYRSTWDKYMVAQADLGVINVNNDVCYYAASGLPPFRPRDFVIHRSWLELPHEKLVCSRSVTHQAYPPNKAHVRGANHLTGYIIRPRPGGRGCQMCYVTHSDPRGNVPSWAANRLAKVVAPRLMKRLYRAVVDYPAWKSRQSRPNWKPWKHADQQMSLPRLDLALCHSGADCRANSADDAENIVVDEASLGADEED